MSNTAFKPLRIAGIVPESIVDGPGIRYVVFTQGCPHHCNGCHNASTHDFGGGYVADIDSLISEIESNPLLSGITISGGEPFCQANALIPLIERIKRLNKSVWIYSGYTYEQLLDMGEAINALLFLCDVLVDGRYIESERDLSLEFRGSRNQRIIQLKSHAKQQQQI